MKKTAIGVLVFLAVASFGTTHLFSSAQERTPHPRAEIPAVRQEVMTQRQRANSRRLRIGAGRNLRDLTLSGNRSGDIRVEIEEPFIIEIPGNSPPPLPFMQATVCNAEAIVVGTLQNATPQLTEGENFLLTEYEMSVHEVIKNNTASPIVNGGNITVVRQGGVGRLNNRVVRATVSGFAPFALGGNYILFLRFIPESSSYLALPDGSFQIRGNEVLPLGRVQENELRNLSSFLNAARATVSTGNCPNTHNNQ